MPSLSTISKHLTFWLILTVHRKYFNKCMKYVKGKKIVDTLNREAVEVKTRRSSVQNVMKAIRARESCLL